MNYINKYTHFVFLNHPHRSNNVKHTKRSQILHFLNTPGFFGILKNFKPNTPSMKPTNARKNHRSKKQINTTNHNMIDHIAEISLYVDASIKQESTGVGLGIIVETTSSSNWKHVRSLSPSTPLNAELDAIFAGLKLVTMGKKIAIHTDSKFALNLIRRCPARRKRIEEIQKILFN